MFLVSQACGKSKTHSESDSRVITHGQDHVDGVHSGGGATYEFFTLLRRKCIW